jgi:hypothetical protein
MTRVSADPPGEARVEGPQLPTRADLDRATAVTAAAMPIPPAALRISTEPPKWRRRS